jgi:hypothetical protein
MAQNGQNRQIGDRQIENRFFEGAAQTSPNGESEGFCGFYGV